VFVVGGEGYVPCMIHHCHLLYHLLGKWPVCIFEGIMPSNTGWATWTHNSMIAPLIQTVKALQLGAHLTRHENRETKPPAQQHNEFLPVQLETQLRHWERHQPQASLWPGHSQQTKMIAWGLVTRKQLRQIGFVHKASESMLWVRNHGGRLTARRQKSRQTINQLRQGVIGTKLGLQSKQRLLSARDGAERDLPAQKHLNDG